MFSSIKKYTIKKAKLKAFSKKRLLKKLTPDLIDELIPDNYLSSNGDTKQSIVKDVWKLFDCCSNLTFVNRTLESNKIKKTETTMFDGNLCNIPVLCPICAEKVGSKRRSLIKDRVLKLSSECKFAYLVTFTAKNSASFNDSYDEITNSIRKYFLLGQSRIKNTARSESAKIIGAAISKEIKVGKNSGEYHVHAHGIVFTNKQIDYSIYDNKKKKEIITKFLREENRRPNKTELSQAVNYWGNVENCIDYETGEITNRLVPLSKASKEWLKITNNQSCNIDFSPLKGNPEEIFNQCIEAIKYTSKINDFDSKQIMEILLNRKNKRFFTTYGKLYNKKDEKEEEIELQINAYSSFIWNNKYNQLVPIDEKRKAEVEFKIKNREKLKKVKGAILSGYHLKEKLISRVMKEYKKEILPSFNKERNEIYKEVTISHINYLSKAYDHFKRRAYKKILGITIKKEDNIHRPSMLQKEFMKEGEEIIIKASKK